MDLRRLASFVAVAQERHFGRAAERLYVAQPALSQQVKALEADLGVRLLDRTTRRVDLTPAGERLLQRGLEILASVEAASEEVRRVDAGEEGAVRLGFIGSATYGVMPELARRLRADLPGLALDLRGELLSPDVVDRLDRGALDVGVLRPFEQRPGLAVRALHSESLVVALPADHALAGRSSVRLAEVADEPFVSYPRQASVMADAVDVVFRRAGLEPPQATQVRETSTLVAFVASGLGVALVPEGVRAVALPGVAYVPLAEADAAVDLVVAWRTDAPQGPVRQVLDRISG